MKTVRMLLVGMVAAMFVAACGGGGGDREFSDSGNTGDTTAPAVRSIVLMTSTPSMASDGASPVTLYATVRDSGNMAVSGIPVSFSTPDSGVVISAVDGNRVSDAAGQVRATVRLVSPANRVIRVRAEAEGRSAQQTVEVVGTSASVSGPVSVTMNRSATYVVTVRDSAGKPVQNETVRVESALGNSVSPQQARTDVTGEARVEFLPSKMGDDAIRVSAAGASAAKNVRVSETDIAFGDSTPPARIDVTSGAVPVRVRVLDANGSPMTGTVRFSATRGTFGATQVSLDPTGHAATTIASSRVGTSLIVAEAPDRTTAEIPVSFVATSPQKIEVQAWPSTVGTNPSGSKAEFAQIFAIVRDNMDNMVEGEQVRFTVVSDPSQGIGLDKAYAFTDEYGRASVNFYPGPNPSGTAPSGSTPADMAVIRIQAEVWDQPAIKGETVLTASRRPLQVRIGTGNEVIKVDELFNEMPFSVLITDSGGNPVGNVGLTATVVPIAYGKGYWSMIPGATPVWQMSARNVCLSEDVNLNLRLDPGEDRNGDGLLTPGGVAAVYFPGSLTPGRGSSDSLGSATLNIRYARSNSSWALIQLRVAANVIDGTEDNVSTSTGSFWLPMLASDLAREDIAPPGQTSPFGVGFCP